MAKNYGRKNSKGGRKPKGYAFFGQHKNNQGNMPQEPYVKFIEPNYGKNPAMMDDTAKGIDRKAGKYKSKFKSGYERDF